MNGAWATSSKAQCSVATGMAATNSWDSIGNCRRQPRRSCDLLRSCVATSASLAPPRPPLPHTAATFLVGNDGVCVCVCGVVCVLTGGTESWLNILILLLLLSAQRWKFFCANLARACVSPRDCRRSAATQDGRQACWGYIGSDCIESCWTRWIIVNE